MSLNHLHEIQALPCTYNKKYLISFVQVHTFVKHCLSELRQIFRENMTQSEKAGFQCTRFTCQLWSLVLRCKRIDLSLEFPR